MCGRYGRRSDKQKIVEHFRATPTSAELPMPDAEYNIAPTTHQPIIRQSRETGHQGSFDDQRTFGNDHEGSDVA